MKRHPRAALVLCALAASAVAVLLLWNDSRVGKVLDGYRGIPVYDNGLLYFRSYGKHYSQNGYYYGQKWQCVEFIKRFFYDAKGHKMPDVMGHAKSFFDDTLSDGALNPLRRKATPGRPAGVHGHKVWACRHRDGYRRRHRRNHPTKHSLPHPPAILARCQQRPLFRYNAPNARRLAAESALIVGY
jgi:hypothetical protein